MDLSFCYLKELRGLARHGVRNFFEVVDKNDKVFAELFFWKTAKDAIEITEGYGSIRAQ